MSAQTAASLYRQAANLLAEAADLAEKAHKEAASLKSKALEEARESCGESALRHIKTAFTELTGLAELQKESSGIFEKNRF